MSCAGLIPGVAGWLGDFEAIPSYSLIDFVKAISKILLTFSGALSTKNTNALSPAPALAPMLLTWAIVVATAFVISDVAVWVS